MENFVFIRLAIKIPIRGTESRYISISNLYKENVKKISCVSQIKIVNYAAFEVSYHLLAKKKWNSRYLLY